MWSERPKVQQTQTSHMSFEAWCIKSIQSKQKIIRTYIIAFRLNE